MSAEKNNTIKIADQLGTGEIASAADRSIRKLIEAVGTWFGAGARPRLIKKRGKAALEVLREFDSTLQNTAAITSASLQVVGAEVQVLAEANDNPLSLHERTTLRVAKLEEV